MSHYYITDKTLGSNKKKLTYTYFGINVELFSDLGIFSKERIDFGTNVLLNNLAIQANAKSILDLGCGYGIIGICLGKKFPDKSITMVDVNERCIELTNENIKKNSLKNATCYLSNLYDNIKGKFDVIVSNPPIRAGKEVVFSVIKKGYEHLNNDGEIWVVIQKKQGAPSLEKLMEEVFGNVLVAAKEKGYYILTSKKICEFN